MSASTSASCACRTAQGSAVAVLSERACRRLDLLAAVPAEAPLNIAPGARALVPTGIAIALPPGTRRRCGRAPGLPRSHGLTVLNAPGTIDADYRGEIQVLLVNLGGEPVAITRGMRIAQLIVAPVTRARLREVVSLDETAAWHRRFWFYRWLRGISGFAAGRMRDRSLLPLT